MGSIHCWPSRKTTAGNFFQVLCVGFWVLTHLTRDLSQAGKKITIITCWATDKMRTIFTQNDTFDDFE